MDKVLSTKATHRDYFNVKNICKEFRMNTSTFLRGAIYHEIERLKSLSEEEKIEKINDNITWNRTKHNMKQSKKQ